MQIDMVSTKEEDGAVTQYKMDISPKQIFKEVEEKWQIEEKSSKEEEIRRQNKDINNFEEKVNLENVLSEFKLYELYHVKFIMLIGLLCITSTMYCSNYIFVAEDVEYRCKYSDCENTNLLPEELKSTLDFKCKIYSLYDNSSMCTYDNLDFSKLKECKQWVYEEKDSFVAEFNLGCKDWKRTLVGTMHSLGYMFGVVLTGLLSDKFGRKSMAIFNAVSGAIVGISKAFATSYWLYIVLEMIEPVIGDSYSATYMLSIESVSKTSRPIIIIIIGVFCTLGSLAKPVIAFLSPNWRIYLLSMYVPSLIFIIYFLWLPESPRWLLNRGETDKAVQILRNAAKTNNILIEENRLQGLKSEENTSNIELKTLIRATFKSKKLFLRLLGCISMWFTTLFSNYTLSINSVSLKGNKYLNCGIVDASELPAAVILFFAVTKCTRKLPTVMSLIFTAIFCGAQSFVPAEYPWLSLLLYSCGRMTAIIGLRMVYLYTAELFPTYTRNTMHALCSSLGRFAVLIAPQTPLLLKYWAGFPSLLVGILSFMTIFVVTLMPETSDDVLPDNVWEAEAVGNRQKKIENN